MKPVTAMVKKELAQFVAGFKHLGERSDVLLENEYLLIAYWHGDHGCGESAGLTAARTDVATAMDGVAVVHKISNQRR